MPRYSDREKQMKTMKIFMIGTIFAVLVLLLLPADAYAGVSGEYNFSSDTASANQPVRKSGGKLIVEIDGARFRIRHARGATETSLDDGATVSFGGDRASVQTALVPAPGCAPWHGNLGPIGSEIRNEKLMLSEPIEGPIMLGMPTRKFSIDQH